MILFIEGGATKVDQSNLRCLENPLLPRISPLGEGNNVVVVVDQKDVLWLEIRVNQAQLVQD